ncbi:MAG TPA: hypothetical protein VM143_07010 [Acidimicrobiales bacterium]|nr:hypothetical protein [Acidimicrobiales bacterium]
MRVGCYPGSFNPPTSAHLAVASAALAACGLDRVDLVVSRVALAKETVSRPLLEDRLSVLQSVVASRPWLGLVVTDLQLLVDVSGGYDVLVLGADKWEHVLDLRFYAGSSSRRDAAVAALPPLAIAPRSGLEPAASWPAGATVLPLGEDHADVSSSAVRAGRRPDWMLEEAAAFDRSTGAWTDPVRYDAWVADGRPG